MQATRFRRSVISLFISLLLLAGAVWLLMGKRSGGEQPERALLVMTEVPTSQEMIAWKGSRNE